MHYVSLLLFGLAFGLFLVFVSARMLASVEEGIQALQVLYWQRAFEEVSLRWLDVPVFEVHLSGPEVKLEETRDGLLFTRPFAEAVWRTPGRLRVACDGSGELLLRKEDWTYEVECP